MVDYSRFDKIVAELSESDDDEVSKSEMRVTRMDAPTAVTIRGRNEIDVSAVGSSATKSVSTSANSSYEQASSLANSSAIDKTTDVASSTREESSALASRFVRATESPTASGVTLNGADNGTFLWSQTADEIIVRVRIPASTKAKDIRVLISSDGLLEVRSKDSTLLRGQLSNGVWDDDKSPFATEEERFDNSMSWELADLPGESHRCVQVNLKKRPPHEGVKVWWKRLFKEGQEQEVDVANIASRNKSSAQSWQKAWDEAHTMFKSARAKEKAESLRTSKNDEVS